MMGSYMKCVKCNKNLRVIRQGEFAKCVPCYEKYCKVKYKKKSDRRIKKENK